MAILLLADHDNASLSDQTAKALTAATKIAKDSGCDVHVLIAGSGSQAAAEQAAKLSGVSKVLLADDASLANNLAEPLAALIVSLADSYDTIISAATSVGKNVLPRVAALLDVAQISEITRGDLGRHLSAADLCRQCHPDGSVHRRQEGDHGTDGVLFPGLPRPTCCR